MVFGKNNRGVSLPINVVVMMIIGILIFGIGLALFSKISTSGNNEIKNLNNRVVNDISSLECTGEDWICSPSFSMNNGQKKIFQIYVSNKANSIKTFSIGLNLTDLGDGKKGITSDNGCGSIVVYYPNIPTKIASGYSASFPFEVIASRVKKTPCSFVTVANLKESEETKGKTPVIIRVK